MRYSIEYLTGKPTDGSKKRLHNNKNGGLVLHRNHGQINLTVKEGCNVVLLLRNYKELVLRDDAHGNINKLENKLKVLFKIYNKFEGNKKIIYYEDILKNFDFVEDVLKNHYDLKIIKNIDKFIKEEAYHRKQSFKVTNKILSDGKSAIYYQKGIEEKRLKDIDERIKNSMGNNYKFLERYA